MQLQTVTGPVPPEAFGLTDGHAHVWIMPTSGIEAESRIELHDYNLIRSELRDFHSTGGGALVDCQPGGAGRDARKLAELSQATGLYITATTGFHLRKYYAPDYWLWSATAEEAAAHFIEELSVGVRESSTVRATTVKVGYTGVIDGQERVLMEAAAEASRQTGALILFHTEKGANVEALLPFFGDRGIPAERLYLCHVDKRPDLELHFELARAGVLLGYDTFVREKYDPEKNAWPLLLGMVLNGFGQSIAVCQDIAETSLWRHYGGEPGLVYLPQTIIPRLRKEGVDEVSITRLTGGNISRRLVWQSAQAQA
ncbi:MAG: hypothetical protein H7175_18755 [Burkholderiales bacterium]|nr:hypothetical protein [Anaerolineae bacterium]